jgi:hypothetical protein
MERVWRPPPEVRVRTEFDLSSQLQSQQRRFERALLFFFLLSLPLLNPWVRGDGVGYYAYVRAPLIEHDLDFTHDYQFANDSFRAARIDENGQIRSENRTANGHLRNHFTVGPAMLWAPFLLVTHAGVLLARQMGSQTLANGFSFPYLCTMAFATGLYGFLGLWLSFRLARKYVGAVWAFVATLAIWWASSLPVYIYFNPSWSHAHSAFVCALFLWYWDETRENRSLRQWLLLGLIAGLMLDVYYPNLMILGVLVVEGIGQYAHILRFGHSSSPSVAQLLGRHLLFGLVVCIAMLPTFVTRAIVYGGPFESGYYSIRTFDWSSPALFSILFSSDHGLLSWTPLLGFAIFGLFLLAFRLPKIGLPFLGALAPFYLFISVYPDWAGISSYGNRFFVSLTPLFILGLAYLLQRLAEPFAHPRMALAVCSTVLACFVLWNLGMVYQWGTHMIPVRGPISFREAAYNQVFVVPSRLGSSLNAYFFRRSALMQQIEQKDMRELDKSADPVISR